MVEVIPAIIPESFEYLKTKLGVLQGLASTVQVDVTDGIFVVGRSWPFGPGDKKQFETLVREANGLPFWEDFDFEVDLMMQRPESMARDWVRAGVSRMVFHIESQHDFSEIKNVVGDEVELGVAIQNKTSIERLHPYIEEVDYVQIMGIETIGKQGEAFSENTLSTIHTLREKYPDVTIQIDGGVSDESAKALVDAGVNRLVSGSYILRSADPEMAIEQLKNV